MRLRASEMARIDTTYLPELAPTSAEQPFTVEVWARVLGCWDINRVLLMNSRYCILATRDNRWAFQVRYHHTLLLLRVDVELPI